MQDQQAYQGQIQQQFQHEQHLLAVIVNRLLAAPAPAPVAVPAPAPVFAIAAICAVLDPETKYSG